jgi:septum formation protein
VLASTSPRRRALLANLGIPFETIDPRVDERPPAPMPPLKLARWAARRKAEAVAARRPGAVVIGADTVVVLSGVAFGKPADAVQARRMLRDLSGRTHQVLTAVHVVWRAGGCDLGGYSRTRVTMRPLSPRVIASYVRSGEVKDKAGAYAIQSRGARLVQSIQGPFDNVVGLPLRLTTRLLRQCGVEVAKSPRSWPDR